jgi:amino acid adenylation domain-containing protein
VSDLRERLAALTPAQRKMLVARLLDGGEAGPDPAAEPIAVIGIGCRLPGGIESPPQLWRALRSGRDLVGPTPGDRWNVDAWYDEDPVAMGTMNTRHGAYLDDIAGFDRRFFGISAPEAERMDPQQRLLLETAWNALQDAGVPPSRLAGSRTGVFVAAMTDDYTWLQIARPEQIDVHTGVGTQRSILANRISHELDVHGPSLTVDTACSSSLSTVHLACQSLRSREAELAIAGGVNVIASPLSGVIYSKLGVLSKRGRCQTFGPDADGFVRGEGASVVVLKPLSDALRDGDAIWGVIRGTALAHGGRASSITAPNGLAQAEVIRAALRAARVAPHEVVFAETHGTGTVLGDPVEVEALTGVLGDGRAPGDHCVLGAIKTNLGHLEAAAGVTGLVKTLLALYHGEAPPVLHFTEQNPHIRLDTERFTIPRSVLKLPERTRIGAVSSFGFGGSLGHALVEAPPAPPVGDGVAQVGPRLLVISAKDERALDEMVGDYADALSGPDAPDWFDAVHTAAHRRDHYAYRIAVVASDAQEAAERLRRPRRQGRRVVHGKASLDGASTVFVFPGQSASSETAGALYAQNTVFRDAIDRCDEALREHIGWSVAESLTGRHPVDPESTEAAQPILFAVQVALTELWRAYGARPGAVVGQSLGEVAAAHAAGALSLVDAARIVTARARLMSRLEGTGTSVVVELPVGQVRTMAERNGGGFGVGGVLGPRTTLVSGREEAVRELLEELEREGVFARRLAGVRVPFHSPEMAMLATELTDRLEGIAPRPADVPMVSTVTGRPVAGPELDGAYWADNMAMPFQLVSAIEETLPGKGATAIEIAPRPVLGHAIGTIAGDRLPVVASLRKDAVGLESFLEAVGTAYTRGVPIDMHMVAPDGRCTRLPGYRWQREPAWLSGGSPPAARAEVVPGPTFHPDLGERPPDRRDASPVGDGPSDRLLELWCETLDLDPAEVDADSSFFAVGGDSLRAFGLVRQLSETFGVRIGLDEFQECASLTLLRRRLDGLDTESRSAGRPTPVGDTRRAGDAESAEDAGDPSDPFPLMPVQKAYWIGRTDALTLGELATRYYVEHDVEDLDLERLERAWNVLIQRHEMLRAVVAPDGRQRVLSEVPYSRIEVEDLSGADPQEAEHRLAELRAELSHQVTPADEWPLCLLRAARLPGRRTRVYLGFDMLVCDGHSIGLLSDELRALYEDRDEPEKVTLPPVERSFRDLVLCHERRRSGEEYRQAREYWAGRAADLPAPPALPTSARLEDIGRNRFARKSARLEPARWRALREAAARMGVSPSSVILTAYAEALGTWSKNSRFSINVTTFNLRAGFPGSDRVVGDFTSTMPLAVDGRSAPTFRERARILQRDLWGGLAHAALDGTEVLALTGDDGAFELGLPFVFTSLLAGEGDPDGSGPVPLSWLGERVFGVSQTPQVLMDLQVMTDRGALVLDFDTVDQAFPAGLPEALLGAVVDLLRTLADDDEAAELAPLALLPPRQRTVRQEVNRTDGPIPTGGLHEPFLRMARSHPDRVAVQDTEAALTYRDVDELSEALADRLGEAGVARGDLVGVRLEKGWRQVVAVIGVLKAGAAYVPIAPDLPAERCRYILEQSSCSLIVQRTGMGRPAGVDGLTCVELDDGARAAPRDREGPHGDDIAYVIFTSGSTGLPKGVVIHHRGALNTVLDINERFGIGPDDRVLGLSALSFDLSVWDIFGVLAAGGAIVLPDPLEVLDPGHWAELADRHRVTVWNSVPALFELFVGHLETAEGTNRTLRLVMLSGDWIPLTLPDRARPVVLEADQVSLGGATEGSIWSIHYPIDAVAEHWRSIPYGHPLRNQRMYVLNEALQMCPDWVVGEIYIGGVGVAKGYQNDPARTAASFLVHPHTGERLYRTGDLGRWLPDGCIEFLGREDLQVKIQGYRIELEEVESTLLDCPGVAQAAVVALGRPGGTRRLAAHVVRAADSGPGERPDEQQVRDHLAGRLPAYMVPPTVRFWDRFPLNANGKVDRSVLADAAASPPDAAASPPEATGGDTPRQAEREVAAAPGGAWDQVVEIVSGQLNGTAVDPERRLSESGAASIDIIRIAGTLQRRFGRRPRLRDLFSRLTVGQVAEFYAGSADLAGSPPRARGADTGDELDAQVILDPDERRRFRAARHDLRRFDPGQPSLRCADVELSARGTVRHGFATGEVPAEKLTTLLGTLREDGGTRRRSYGSAGALYPVQIYLRVAEGRVADLPGGDYYFDPVGNRLVQIREAEPDPALHLPENRELAEAAAFTVFLVGRLAAIAPLYGARSRDFVLIEAGAITHELERTAVDAGLALRQIGDMRTEPVREVLGLAPEDEIVHVLIGGAPGTAGSRDGRRTGRTEQADDAFPLSDTQQALWVGRTGEFGLGRVSTHSYLEFEVGDLDVERLNTAWREVIGRHEMLRAVVRQDAMQQVLPEVPPYEVEVVDLRGQRTEAEFEAEVARTRTDLSHRVVATDQWPLVHTRVLLGDGHARVAMSVDSQLLDAYSVNVMLRDLARAYQEPGSLPPAPGLTFREYLEREAAARGDEEWRRSKEYWDTRLPDLPAAPRLPVVREPGEEGAQRFTRKQLVLDPRRWSAFRDRARANGCTASSALCTAFAAVLAQYSAGPRFTLNLTLFDRQQEYGDVQELVGQLNRTALLPLDLGGSEAFNVQAHAVQDELWSSLEHRRYSGVSVMRELASRWQVRTAPIMPVVFTSMLDLPSPGDLDRWVDWLGEPVLTLTQTPQVWIEHGVLERRGSLHLYWDVVEGLLPAGVLDAMFAAYGRLVEELSESDETWERGVPGVGSSAAAAEATTSKAAGSSRPPEEFVPVPGRPDRLSKGFLDRLLRGHVERLALSPDDRIWPADRLSETDGGMVRLIAEAADATLGTGDVPLEDTTVCVTDVVTLTEWLRDPASTLPARTRLVVIVGCPTPIGAGRALRQRAPHVGVVALFGPAALGGTGLVCDLGASTPRWTPVPGVCPLVLDDERRIRPDLVPGRLWFVLDQADARPAGVVAADADHGRPVVPTSLRARRDSSGSVEGLGYYTKPNGRLAEPWETEAVALGHPGVLDAAVVPAEDAPEELVAYVCGTAPDLADYLARRLPEYLLPSRIVTVDEIPRDRAGVPDLANLPAPERVRAPGHGRVAGGPEAPGELLETVADILSDVLGRRLGVQDNLFDHGATSVHLIRIRAMLRRRTGAEVPVVEMFRYPSIAALAARAATGQGPEPEQSTEQSPGGDLSHEPSDAIAAARERARRRRAVRR